MKLWLALVLASACFGASQTSNRQKLRAEASGTPSMHLVVLFRADVNQVTAEHILSSVSLKRLERSDLLPNQYLIETSFESAITLAKAEEIAYLYPASTDLIAGAPVHGCLGPLAGDTQIAQYVATLGQGWDGKPRGAAEITYSYSALGQQVAGPVVTEVVERALAAWSKEAQIRFRFTTSTNAARNINFVFATGMHGDPYGFDGRGRVLAHTFYPSDVTPEPLAGDIHIDDAEPWSTKLDPDLYSVILHEIGHSLGLGHSDRPGSVMYPYYRRLDGLQADDIAALRRLYAAPEVETPLNPVTPTSPAPQTPTTPAPTTPTPTTPAPTTPAPTVPVVGDTTAPTVAITFPAVAVYSTSAATVRVTGTARDVSGIQAITWSSSTGLTGEATASSNWKISSIPLLVGDNRITVYVRDASGNTAQRSVLVTRR
jgi:hypothetical protein